MRPDRWRTVRPDRRRAERVIGGGQSGRQVVGRVSERGQTERTAGGSRGLPRCRNGWENGKIRLKGSLKGLTTVCGRIFCHQVNTGKVLANTINWNMREI